MTRSAILLGLFALVGTGIVALVYLETKQPIAEAERAFMLRSLHEVIKPALHDNDIFSDVITVTDPELLGTPDPVPVFRARRNGRPVALAITPIAPEGYVGPIKLLVGINVDGSILGVRVLSHRETPGLGDSIEVKRSPWILSFNGRSLNNPKAEAWSVRRDGGEFDQFTGATITPRAVVKAVHNALVFYEKNKDWLFKRPTLKAEKPLMSHETP
ncbi:MAG TPA: electron transport complex subunit RsxG [Gammaproteobacteria bacterium]|nr:electron transport complex subunit RsxG [Gammaproteobacteria bacterium]